MQSTVYYIIEYIKDYKALTHYDKREVLENVCGMQGWGDVTETFLCVWYDVVTSR